MAAYLTFDIGTTALKTALVGEDGALLGLHRSEYTFKSPRPDWTEMDPETYWSAVVEGTRAVMGQSPAAVKAIGLSSQGQTFVPIDRTGRPLYSAIVWTDNRAQAVADEWERNWLSREEYRRISGYPGLPAQLTVFKVAWLTSAPDALFEARYSIIRNVWKFLCLPDYLIWRLTGEAITDHVTAQFSGFYDLRTDDWEPRLLAAAQIRRENLPRVVKSGTIVGSVTPGAAAELGIPSGTAVCAGANDQICAALGAGNVIPGIVSESTGTALAVVATMRKLPDDARMLVGKHADPTLYFALAFGTTSAIVLKWLRDLCAPELDYDEFLADVESVTPGCEGLSVLPHFAGTASPTFNPHARGAFVGLSLGHTRAHLARAVMESCACMLKECLSLVQEHGVVIDCVRSLGAAARSDLWLQMKADMIGVPVERPLCSDAPSLGAAMLAAVATGQFTSVRDAVEAWYRSSQTFEPNSRHTDVYDEVYNRYLELYDKLYGS